MKLALFVGCMRCKIYLFRHGQTYFNQRKMFTGWKDSKWTSDGKKNAHEVAKNEVAEIIVSTKKPIAFDTFDEVPETGRFVIVHERDVRGGGIILKRVEYFSAI